MKWREEELKVGD
jgi:hypothetical protein